MKRNTSKKIEQMSEPELLYPSIYFNGFEVTISAADVIMTAKIGNDVVGKFYMSHGIAKTIVDLLGRSLAAYEENAGITIHTTQQISSRLEGKEGFTLE